MSLAVVIYQKRLDLPADEAQEVIKFIELIKTHHTLKKPANTIIEPLTDYEQAQQQALAFLDAPPFMLSGRYWSRDSLYDRLD
jgi:hypothetical protein